MNAKPALASYSQVVQEKIDEEVRFEEEVRIAHVEALEVALEATTLALMEQVHNIISCFFLKFHFFKNQMSLIFENYVRARARAHTHAHTYTHTQTHTGTPGRGGCGSGGDNR